MFARPFISILVINVFGISNELYGFSERYSCEYFFHVRQDLESSLLLECAKYTNELYSVKFAQEDVKESDIAQTDVAIEKISGRFFECSFRSSSQDSHVSDYGSAVIFDTTNMQSLSDSLDDSRLTDEELSSNMQVNEQGHPISLAALPYYYFSPQCNNEAVAFLHAESWYVRTNGYILELSAQLDETWMCMESVARLIKEEEYSQAAGICKREILRLREIEYAKQGIYTQLIQSLEVAYVYARRIEFDAINAQHISDLQHVERPKDILSVKLDYIAVCRSFLHDMYHLIVHDIRQGNSAWHSIQAIVGVNIFVPYYPLLHQFYAYVSQCYFAKIQSLSQEEYKSRVDNFFVAITLKYAKSVKDCLEEIDEVSRENKDIKQICAILSIMHHYHNDQRVCVIYDLVPLYMLALLNNTIHREPWVAMLLLNLRIGYETNKMAVWAMLKFVSVDKNIAGALRNLELEYLQAGGFDENVRELAAAMHANMGEIWNVQEFVALAKECKASCIEFTKRFCKEWELIKSGRVKEDEIKMLRKKIKIPYEPIARKLYDHITKKIVANNVSEAQIHSVLDVVVSGFDAFANSLTQLTGMRPDFSKEQLQELYNKIV